MEIFTMKKSLIALAMASTLGFSVAHADTKVFGVITQSVEQTDNGSTKSWDVNNGRGGTFIGITSSEDLGDGASAYAKISLDVTQESNSAATTKDAIVGLKASFGSVEIGRQKDLKWSMVSDAYVDRFEGADIGIKDFGRNSNSVTYRTPSMGGFSASVQSVTDGSTGQTGADELQYGATYSNGVVSVSVVAEDDKANNKDNLVVGGAVTMGNLRLSGAWESLDENDGTAKIETSSVVAAMTMGSNIITAGYQTRDEGNDVKVVEAKHNFTKRTAAFVNYHISSPQSGTDTKTFGLGLRHAF
jgi:predicted porin